MKKIGLSGLILAGGLSLFSQQSYGFFNIYGISSSQSNNQQQTQTENYEHSTEEAGNRLRESFRLSGYNAKEGDKEGDKGGNIAESYYSSRGAWQSLLDSNFARGNVSQHYAVVFMDKQWRTERDMHWNQKTMYELRWLELRAGDHLEFPEKVVSKDGITYNFNKVFTPQEILDELEIMRMESIRGLKPRSQTGDFTDFFPPSYQKSQDSAAMSEFK